MAIPSALLKNLYFSYALGTVDGKVEYSEPIKIYAQVEDVKSLVLREDVGVVPDYDRLILVPFGENTQYIDEQALLWINVEPNANKSNMDYKIERVGDIIDNNFILYCNSLTPSTKPLYYYNNNKIYQVKVDFDSENLTALVPFNKFFPIDKDTKVWTTKPTNAEATKNLISLENKEKLGKSYKLTFKKVGE